MKLIYGITVIADIIAVLIFFFLSRKYIHKYGKEKDRSDLRRSVFFLICMTAAALLGIFLKFVFFQGYRLF